MASARSRAVFAVLIAILVLGLIAGGIARRTPGPPAAPAPAPEPGAAPASPGPECMSSADCRGGYRCVGPGVCSQACKADSDCATGRRCAELRLANPGEDGASAPGTATTCVVATPP
jgi:Cys-rich repeat protein